MSTSAIILIPSGDKYWVDSDGYPEDIVPYLRDIVTDVKETAEEKFVNPEDNWTDELKLEMDGLTEGYYSELDTYDGRSMGSHTYKITEDGEVLHKEKSSDDFEEPNL